MSAGTARLSAADHASASASASAPTLLLASGKSTSSENDAASARDDNERQLLASTAAELSAASAPAISSEGLVPIGAPPRAKSASQRSAPAVSAPALPFVAAASVSECETAALVDSPAAVASAAAGAPAVALAPMHQLADADADAAPMQAADPHHALAGTLATPPPKKRSLLGMGLLAAASFVFSLMNVSIRLSTSDGMPLFQELMFRMTVQCLATSAWMAVEGISPRIEGPLLWLVLVRSFLAITNTAIFFYALRFLALAEVQVLFFTSSVLTGMGGRIFLGEVFGLFEVLASLVTFVGVVFVSQPRVLFGGTAATGPGGATAQSRVLGVFLCLAGAIIGTAALLLVRKIGSRVHFQAIGLYMSAMGTVSMPVLMLLSPAGFVVPHRLWDWTLLLLIGVFGTIGQMLLNRGNQLEDALVSNLISVLGIIFGLLWSLLLLHDRVTMYSGIGAVFVTAGVVAVAVKRYQRANELSFAVTHYLPTQVDELSDTNSDNAMGEHETAAIKLAVLAPESQTAPQATRSDKPAAR